MNWLKTLMKTGVVALTLFGASMSTTKPAQADGGAIIAGVAGGLLLGTIIGSNAHANSGYYTHGGSYYSGSSYYSAPRYYAPPVTFSYSYVDRGPRYYRPHRTHRRWNRPHRRHYGHRHGGHRKYRGHRNHYRHW